ncbi:MAG TPA: AAA family ATPase, partial [Myxococcota bacterium]|nr:AAA family ATPase [Myxococcota bacterium]
PGVGKTLLLRLLMRRLAAAFTPLYVPSAALAASDVERWIRAALGAGEREPCDALAQRLASHGRPLLLAIDEGQLASPELVARWEALCTPACSARAAVAWTQAEGEPTPAALTRCATRTFLEPFDLSEVAGYVASQLARSGAGSSERAVLSGETLERIALASGGNPRAIQRLADAELAAHAWRTRAERASESAAPASAPSAPRPRSAPAAATPNDSPADPPRGRRLLPIGLALAGALLAGIAIALVVGR